MKIVEHVQQFLRIFAIYMQTRRNHCNAYDTILPRVAAAYEVERISGNIFQFYYILY